jgi:ABC-type transport system involved in multi-copper enzyme maturation permease subunit
MPTRFVAATVRSTLIEALRSRLFAIVLIAIAASLGLGSFLGELTITETTPVQATIIAALLRLAMVFLLIVFVVSSMVREFQDQVVAIVLSQPLPRWAYVVGRLVGFFCVALALAMLAGLALLPFAAAERAAVWSASLACELFIVAAACLFCTLTLSHFVAAFAAVSAFYLLGRSFDAIQIIASAAGSTTSLADRAIDGFVATLAYLLPHIGRMTQSAWLVQPDWSASVLAPVALQATVYCALLFAASLFDFHRENL